MIDKEIEQFLERESTELAKKSPMKEAYYKEVPISAAEQIAKDFDKQEVIILSVDREFNKVHITTFGVGELFSKNAEITGDFLAEIFQLRKPQLYFDLIEKAKEIWKNRKAK